MSKIPLARSLVAAVAAELPKGHTHRAQLEAALQLMVRKRPIKRARQKSRNLTLSRACAIWRYYRLNPDASHQEMGDLFEVNPGRISQVLTGERYPEAKSISLKDRSLPLLGKHE